MRKFSKKNRSGYHGVSWHRRSGKWQAVLSLGSSNRHIGIYDEPEEAAEAWQRAKKKQLREKNGRT